MDLMHIGFLTPEYVLPGRIDGGLANYIRKTGLALAERGHDVSVFVLSDRNGRFQDNALTIHEIKRIRFRHMPALAQILSARRLAKTVWRVHRAEPIDVLQSSNYMIPGYALRGNGRIPLVCRLSSYTPLWRAAYGRQPALKESLSDRLELRQILDADVTFAPSQFMADHFQHAHGIPPRVIRTPIGKLDRVELDDSFYRRELNGRFYLLFFGTLSRIKGVDLLVDIFPALFAQFPDLQFVFIGRDDGLPGGQKMANLLKSTACPEKIHTFPALPKSQLIPIISQAAGVLMPSRVDNYPNACLEAQALGIPVIGTTRSSLDEMVEEGVTGFIAENGSSTSFRQAIERLLALSPSERDGMRENILSRIVAARAEDRIGQLLRLYEGLLKP